MANDAETLFERQKLRRRLLFWRILFVAALIVVGILAFGRVKGEASGAYVALLDVTGVIESDRVRDEAIKDVAQDNNAKALVLRINICRRRGPFYRASAVCREQTGCRGDG
ncbi:MAG: hypothetical protein ACKVH7_05565 [Alphaproteobacteria bacterium]